MILADTVHTTGINWGSVLTIVCAVVAATSIIFGSIARSVTSRLSREITGAINQFRIDVIQTLDTRLTRVEQSTDDLKNTRGRDTRNDTEHDTSTG